jgi:hypothetical protein
MAAEACFDGFSHTVRVVRTIDDMLVKRRHRPGDVVDKRGLLAGEFVENAIPADQLGQDAHNHGVCHPPLASGVHRGLHAVSTGQAPLLRDETAKNLGQEARVHILGSNDAALGNGNNTFGHGNHVVGADCNRPRTRRWLRRYRRWG